MENESLKIDVEIAKSKFVDQVVVFNKWIESLKMGNKLLQIDVEIARQAQEELDKQLKNEEIRKAEHAKQAREDLKE